MIILQSRDHHTCAHRLREKAREDERPRDDDELGEDDGPQDGEDDGADVERRERAEEDARHADEPKERSEPALRTCACAYA